MRKRQAATAWWGEVEAPHGGNNPVPLLAAQERITIHFYDSTETPERSLQVFNSLRGFFASIEQTAIVRPWTMRQFDTAREAVYRQYPEIMDLWRSLRPE
jgi:hypothetical protein